MVWRAWVIPLLLAAACSSRHGPRDVGNQHPRSAFVDGPGGGVHRIDAGPPAPAEPRVTGRKPHVLVKATTRALATRGALVYYGDAAEDGLYTIPKLGGDPVRAGQRAPVTNGIASTGDAIVWIGSPGDTVLRLSGVDGMRGPQVVVRDHGIFSNLGGDSDIWLTEAHGSGGTLVAVGTTASGTSAGASFDSPPRGLAVDADRIIVATQTKLLAFARGRGDPETLASGDAFASPVVAADAVYATVASGTRRALVRVSKTGGPLTVVAAAVRDAPIALHRDTLYWFDTERPALLASTVGEPADTPPRIVSEDESYERAVAITIDDDGIFVATGTSDDGLIQLIPVR